MLYDEHLWRTMNVYEPPVQPVIVNVIRHLLQFLTFYVYEDQQNLVELLGAE